MKRVFSLLFLLVTSYAVFAQTPKVADVDYSTKTGTVTDARDGKTYAYKRYGNFEWFMQNLNWDGYDGKANLTHGTVGYSNPNDPSGEKYGRFYPVQASYEEVCPCGWSVATQQVWTALARQISSEYNINDINVVGHYGNEMKNILPYLKAGFWSNSKVINNKSKEIQFNLLPSGIFDGESFVKDKGEGNSASFLIGYKNRFQTFDSITLRTIGGANGIGSVRCVRAVATKAKVKTPYPTTLSIKQINSAEKERLRLAQNMKKFDNVLTGFYLPKGKSLEINVKTLNSAKDGAKPYVVIGTHGQISLEEKDKIQPREEIELKDGLNTISASQHGGGMVYFRYVTEEKAEPVGRVQVSFTKNSEQVRAPHYVYGTTSEDEFATMMANYGTPEVIYSSGYVVAVAQKTFALEHSYQLNKKEWMRQLDKIMEIEDEISGLDDKDSNPLHHRLKKGEIRHLLVHSHFASPHATQWRTAYPGTSRYLTLFDTTTRKDETGVKINDTWQVGHECGHQHQQGAYLIPQSGESTVNIYSFAVRRHFNYKDKLYVHTTEKKLNENINEYLNLPDDWRIYEMPDKLMRGLTKLDQNETRMVPWEQMFYIFGDDFFKRLHRVTREEAKFKDSNDDAKHYLIWKASEVSGYDLRPFYAAWGIKIFDQEIQKDLNTKMDNLNLPLPARIEELHKVSGTKFANGEYEGWLPLKLQGKGEYEGWLPLKLQGKVGL